MVSLVRVENGVLKTGEKMQVMSTGKAYEVSGIGIFTPKRLQTDILRAGEVGYVTQVSKTLTVLRWVTH